MLVVFLHVMGDGEARVVGTRENAAVDVKQIKIRAPRCNISIIRLPRLRIASVGSKIYSQELLEKEFKSGRQLHSVPWA